MTVLASSAILLAQGHHLTLHRVLVNVPHDATAFIVYFISALSVGWVIKEGLKKPDPDQSGDS